LERGIDVSVLMEHVHRQLAASARAAADGRSAGNPLWTNLSTDWGKIHFLLRQAERDGRIGDILANHIPSYPHLTKVARFLGLRHLRPVLLLPCQLALRALRTLIFKAGGRQERVNLSLIGCGQGIAHRLADCEGSLADYDQRLTALEERLAAQLAAPPSQAPKASLPVQRRAA
jgi:hypothetical protein